MATLYDGRLSVLFLTLAVIFIIGFVMLTQKKPPKLRKLPGVEAIKEMVGRSVEMAKALHFTPGWTGGGGSLNSASGAEIIAGMSFLKHAANLVASYGGKILVTLGSADLVPMSDGIVRNEYSAAGKLEKYRSEDIRFLSDNQWAYASGVLGILTREGVGANIMIGPFKAESLLFAEAASTAGAIQVAGTTQITQIPFFVAICDYVLLGEEVYAGAAYLSEDAHQLGSIRGTDISKIFIVAIMVVGVVLSLLGIQVVTQFLKI